MLKSLPGVSRRVLQPRICQDAPRPSCIRRIFTRVGNFQFTILRQTVVPRDRGGAGPKKVAPGLGHTSASLALASWQEAPYPQEGAKIAPTGLPNAKAGTLLNYASAHETQDSSCRMWSH
jgi:hypothetical protein